MYFKSTIILLLLFVSRIGLAQTIISTDYKIGDSKISVEELCFNDCRRNTLFINVHDNEKTSVSAATSFLAARFGRLIRLLNAGERNVNFILQSKNFTFDPNRIFSEEGRVATLKTQSSSPFEPAAETEVSYLAFDLLTKYIDSSKLIVALHNNTDSNLSVLTYQKDQGNLANSGKVFISSIMDPDDFILTTDTTIFNELAARNINAVWENNTIIKDDGSLSIYAALHGITYLNVEAQHEHLDEQLAMLEAVGEIIGLSVPVSRQKEASERISAKEYRYAPDR